MKTFASKIADALFMFFLRTTVSGAGKREVSSSAYGHVILAPSSRGNLGDEAMLTASISEIRNRSKSTVTVLTHADSDDWSDIAPDIKQVSIQGYFSPTNFKKALNILAGVFSSAESFSILGADVMDGAYSRTRTLRRIAMADMASQLGAPTRILGFSYSDRSNPATHVYLERISKNVALHARDIKSYERLQKIAQGPLLHVADTAFLLSPADPVGATTERALQFIVDMRESGKKVIAFNANPLGTSMSSGAKKGSDRLENLDTLVARQVTKILEKDPDVVMVFVPHDPREPHNDRALLQDTFNAQNPTLKNRIFLAFEGISARDVKSICKASDLTVTGRMHMGIASLGAKTPALFLDFQGKVRGLLEHFDVPNLYFDWALYQEPELFADFVLKELAEAPVSRAKIEARYADVVALSRSNFNDFS